MTVVYWSMEYIATFIETIMCCIFCGTFLTKDTLLNERKIIFVATITALLVCILNSYKLFSYGNSLIALLILTSSQWILYKKRKGFSLVLILVYATIVSAIDFSIAQVVSLTLNVDPQYLLNVQNVNRLVCIIFSKSVLALVIIVISKININSKILPQKYTFIMCIYSMFIFTSNFVMVHMSIAFKERDIALFWILFFIASVGLVLLLLYFMFKITQNHEQEQTFALIRMKNEMLQKSQEDTELAFKLWRNSIHDYKNNIIALTQMAEDGNLQEIKTYLNQENKLVNQKMFYIKTGNSVVDAIINTKRNLAEEKGIIFTVNAVISENCKVNNMDMASILGNLIDNAIEACSNEDNAYIDITIKEEKKIVLIKVSNTYSGEFQEQMQSTKEDRKFHGIGLNSVKNTVDKYNGEYSIVERDNEVVATVLLLNK